MNYFLMKSEPNVYSIDDLKKDRTCHWEGVRSYAARKNILSMQPKDNVLFYHSRINPIGIAGLAEITKAAYPDFTAWDPKSHYFDPKTDKENPRWFMVDIKFISILPASVTNSVSRIPVANAAAVA